MALVDVHQSKVKTCTKCGCAITFIKNRNDKSYAVEVFPGPRGQFVYRANVGAYNNLTMWHDCRSKMEALEREKAEREAAALKFKKDEVSRIYLPRLMEIAQNYTPEREQESLDLCEE